MQIWVDADACPKVIKEILLRASKRVRVPLIFVANKPLRLPESELLKSILVPQGFDVADNEIVQKLHPGDLVITADIPLASEVIGKGGHALNPRGSFYTTDNIKEFLTIRNFMDELRSTGVITGGPATFSQHDRQAFANQLDSFLTKNINK